MDELNFLYNYKNEDLEFVGYLKFDRYPSNTLVLYIYLAIYTWENLSPWTSNLLGKTFWKVGQKKKKEIVWRLGIVIEKEKKIRERGSRN